MTDAEKIQFIVGYYSLENQLVQTAEEAAELTKAAIKRHKALKEKDTSLEDRISTQAALVEKIADVMIMIRQIVYAEGIEDDVKLMIDEKLNRQMERIKAVSEK